MAANPFAAGGMAAGYARSRPPVHERVIALVAARLGLTSKFHFALDVGCGAGLSTQPLTAVAHECIGTEPAEAMLRWHDEIAPDARFVAGAAEALPFRTASVDVIAAAGSLNYIDLSRFFPEAKRILKPRGLLLAYDFSPGKSFCDSDRLDRWFARFIARYPWPPGEAKEISPEILAQLNCGFRVQCAERFEIPLTLAVGFYVEYMMTETNVAYAIRNGAPPDKIRSWCSATLDPVFSGRVREVLFRGYFACLEPVI